MNDSIEKLALGLALTVANDDPPALADGLRTVVCDDDKVMELMLALLTISGTLVHMVGNLTGKSSDEIVAILLDSYKDE